MTNKATVNQTTIGPMGLPVTEQVEVDSNRLSVYSESMFRWSNALAIPSRGTFTDAAMWILSVACPLRLLDSLTLAGVFPLQLSISVAGLLLAVPLVLTLQAWNARRYLRTAILYRGFLAVVGVAIAIIIWF